MDAQRGRVGSAAILPTCVRPHPPRILSAPSPEGRDGARHRPQRMKREFWMKRTRAPSGRSLGVKNRSPGAHVRRFLSFASRTSRILVALPPPSARSPSKAGGPVLVPGGRVTPRLPVNPERRARDAVCESLPGLEVWWTPSRRRRSPPALSEPLPEAPSCGQGWREHKRGRGDGDNFFVNSTPPGSAS